MRLKLFVAMAAVLLCLIVSPVLAQDPGIPDTIRLGCPVNSDLKIGDSIAIPVYLFNDEPLGGLTLGFIKDSSAVRFLRFVKNPAVIPATYNWKTTISDTVKGRTQTQSILIGGADFTTEAPILAVTGSTGQLLGTIYLKMETGTVNDSIRIDSLMIPPAGRWEGTPDGIVSFSPLYEHCIFDIYIGVVSVQEYDSPSLPETYTLGQNTPNPFNPNTSIEFALPRSGQVKVEVFNILGQKVRTLVDENLKAGFKRVDWDGTDDGGQSVASGIYLYRMTANDFSETKKMVLMK